MNEVLGIIGKIAWSFSGWRGFDNAGSANREKYNFEFVRATGYGHEWWNFYENFDEFKPYVEMCINFLRGFSLTLQASKVEFFSLMIPMEKLFEEFISTLLEERLQDFFKAKPVPQKSVGYLAVREGRGEFSLIPDIVIERNGKKYLIDTKYKLLNPEDRKLGVSQQDLYQMHAYAAKTKAEKILLLYPHFKGEEVLKTKWDIEFEGWKTELFVRTVNLHYDLRKEENKFIDELESVLGCLISGEELYA